jgi:hypothetical protein
VTAIDTTINLSAEQLSGLRAAGVTAVSRYIAHSTSIGKIIPLSEVPRYAAAGMQLVLNWEQNADDLRTLDVGKTGQYAREAVAMAQARSYPAGCAIYVSADWDVTASQWPTVAGNLRVIRPIYSAAGYRLGLYGPYDALGWAKRDGLVDFYWQAGMSTAWSGRRNASVWPGAHLRQRRNTSIAGVACDTNDILITQFGQWSAAVLDATISKENLMFLSVDGGGQYFLCDHIRARRITVDDARIIAYSAASGFGATLDLKTGVPGRNPSNGAHEWVDLPNGHGGVYPLAVRAGYGSWAGVEDVQTGLPGVTPEQLLAALRSALAEVGTLTKADVETALARVVANVRLTATPA